MTTINRKSVFVTLLCWTAQLPTVLTFAPPSSMQWLSLSSPSSFITKPFPSNNNNIILFDYADDSSPSDYDTNDLLTDTKQVLMVDHKEEDEVIRDALKRELLLLASVTDRGMYATREEQDIAIDLVTQLEALNPTIEPAGPSSLGDWDLCYATTYLFRSSPFFQSIRVAVGNNNKILAENGFDLHHQATMSSRLGRVRQSITETKLVSEVDLQVSMMPGIPFFMTAKGTVVTTAALKVTGPSQWELQVETTKVKGSNLPLVNLFMDELQLELPVGDVYQTLLQGQVPVIPMKTFYVDESLRITRDIDDNFFVFVRES